MTSILAAAIISFVISTTICPFGIKLLKKNPRSDKSMSEFRQMHKEYIPRIGGLGIVIGLWTTIGMMMMLKTGFVNTYILEPGRIQTILKIAGLSITAFILGFLDDLFDIRARYKLFIQITIGVSTAIVLVPLEEISIPFLGNIGFGPFGVVVSTLWIVGVMNAFNLIDGLDSLAGGIALIAMATVAIQAWISKDMMFFMLSLTIMSAICGFIIYNIYPAKVFMGDGGSLFLGFLLAVLPLLQIKAAKGSWSIAPIFLLGVPLVDTGFSILRRYLRGIPIFSPDRNHIHHKLIAKGLTHRQAVRRLHFISILYSIIFIASTQDLIPLKLGLISFIGLSWLLVFFAGYEELTKPLDILKNRTNLKEDRSFVFNLSNNIEVFLKNAQTHDELLYVLKVWAVQIDAIEVKVSIADSSIMKTKIRDLSVKDQELKSMVFKKNNAVIELKFDKKFFELDSDTKLKSIDQAANLFVKYFTTIEKRKNTQSNKIIRLH